MQGTSDLAPLPLGVHLRGDGERIRVELQQGIDVIVRLVVAQHIALDELHRGQSTLDHGLLHVVDGGFLQLEGPAWGHREEICCARILLEWKEGCRREDRANGWGVESLVGS